MKKLRIEVAPSHDGEVRDLDDILAQASAHAWSDDPGTGRSVLLKDERGNGAYEVFNPMPFAAPIGWEATPPLDQLIAERVRSEFQRLRDDEVIDSEEEANDFDVDDEAELSSVYEFVPMEETAPQIRGPLSPEEEAKKYVDTIELVEREKLNRKRAREQALEQQRKRLLDAENEAALYASESPKGEG